MIRPDGSLRHASFRSAWHDAVVNAWWNAFLDALDDIGRQYAHDQGACTTCGTKATNPVIKVCTWCGEPFAGHDDVLAADAPLADNAGYDG